MFEQLLLKYNYGNHASARLCLDTSPGVFTVQIGRVAQKLSTKALQPNRGRVIRGGTRTAKQAVVAILAPFQNEEMTIMGLVL